jgi:hypothetical protein
MKLLGAGGSFESENKMELSEKEAKGIKSLIEEGSKISNWIFARRTYGSCYWWRKLPISPERDY